MGNNNECVISDNCQIIKDCFDIPDSFWLDDKCSTTGDGYFMLCLGVNNYKARMINKISRIYHYDAEECMSRLPNIKKMMYNDIVSNRFSLDKAVSYFFYNPKYFISMILKFSIATIALKLSIRKTVSSIRTLKFRIIFIISLPVCYMLYLQYVIRRKKNFWYQN
jgi:hypothetical protein